MTECSDPYHYVVNVEAAVYRDGEYLLGKRSEQENHAAGTWGLVGGKVENDDGGGDVLEATAAREVNEEVGVDVGDAEYVHSTTFVDDEGDHVVNVVFLCRHESGEPTPQELEEVTAVQWLPQETIADRDDVPPYTREYVRLTERRRRELGW